MPAVVYAFLLRRTGAPPASGAARFEARLLDDDSGVGTQVVAGDVSGDGRVDVVIGNKKGTFVLRQRGAASAPAPPASGRDTGELPRDEHGRELNLDFERGTLEDWESEDEGFLGQPVRGDTVTARGRVPSRHQGGHWIGGYELAGDGKIGMLRSARFRVTHPWASFLIGGGGGEDGAARGVPALLLRADSLPAWSS